MELSKDDKAVKTDTKILMENKTTQKPFLWRLRLGERRLLLVVGDFICTALSLFAALYVWGAADEWFHFSSEFLSERTPYWFYVLPFLWLIFLTIFELYDSHNASRRKETIRGILFSAVGYIALYMIIYFTSEPNSLPRRGVAVFISSSLILTLLWRTIYIRIFTTPMLMKRVLIVGAGRAGQSMAEVVEGLWPPPFHVVGLVDDDQKKLGTEIAGFKVLGNSDELMDLVEREKISDLIFAISGSMKPEMFQALITAEELGVEVTTMPSMYEQLLGRVPILLLQSDWILRSFVDQAHTGGLYEIGKRLIDILGGLVGVLVMILLFPFVAILTVIDSGLPIFYNQSRMGKNGQEYNIIKFRTMRQDAEKDGKERMAVENDARITRVGKLLRKSHIDEFPQFVNVLRGDMSLVGPRPEQPKLVEELQEKVPFYRARLLVKPGVTGWAQINQGYVSNIEGTAVKLEYDLYYIKHRDLFLDFQIIIRTIGSVIGFRGQ